MNIINTPKKFYFNKYVCIRVKVVYYYILLVDVLVFSIGVGLG